MTKITIILTEEDKNLIKNKAIYENLSLSSYIRYHILKLIKLEDTIVSWLIKYGYECVD